MCADLYEEIKVRVATIIHFRVEHKDEHAGSHDMKAEFLTSIRRRLNGSKMPYDNAMEGRNFHYVTKFIS